LMVLMLPVYVSAEIVLDGTQGGTAGQSVGLQSNTYQLDADTMANTTSGSNAFFSFSTFNVESGNTANFTASSSYDNVLARVTGGNASMINGNITTDIPGANVWLINPSGVLFGAGASVDLAGSFHVSSADYILMPGGMQYHTDTSKPFVAVAGNPQGLGFESTSAATRGDIVLLDASVSVGSAESITLAGANVVVDGSALDARNGQVQLLSITSSGEVIYSDNVIQSATAGELGDVRSKSSVLLGNVTVIGDDVQSVAIDDHAIVADKPATPETLKMAKAEAACLPKVFVGGAPLEFEVHEKEEGTHYFVRLSSRSGKANIDKLQECTQP